MLLGTHGAAQHSAAKRSRFLNSGDSGSLMVEDVATNPRAVGLLYAGSSSVAIANPIDEVLSHFGVTMVGGAAPAGAITPAETGPGSRRAWRRPSPSSSATAARC